VELIKPLPPDRSLEQVTNHYLVEKAIAERLKKSSREERKLIHATMYDELFSKVPDHPRLTQRQSAASIAQANVGKFSIVSRFLDKSTVFMEFAPGDCGFVTEVAKQVKCAYGADISDQSDLAGDVPQNFKRIIYDGYNLDEIESDSIDVAFSDQLIEHLHPDDTRLHFELVHRILKTGGAYVFRTPHAFRGPFDVSQYFSDQPEGFHLKEWTYSEIFKVVKDAGYTKFHAYRKTRGKHMSFPHFYFTVSERILGLMPRRYMRRAAGRLVRTLYGAAVK